MKIRLLVFLSLCTLALPLCAEIEFIPLYHQSPEKIVKKIQPFLQQGEVAVAGHNEIILRAEAGTIIEMLQLIKKLDQAAHRLLILVNRDGRFDEQEDGYQVNGDISINTASRNPLNAKAKAKIYSTKSISNEKSTEKIQVLDGYSAFISTGINEATPVIQIQQYGIKSHITTGTEYHEASKGFYVTPRLSRNSVILEISPWKEEPFSKNRTSAKFNRVSTVVRGRLNSWIALAGINDNSQQSQTKMLGHHYQTTSTNNQIWVKVIDLDAE
ncbi:MAG: nodulation protein NolW [Piscirickettsiaceae bacterium]|nr:MAG: nodulation protein NolW [Piscirickettsiaceae bacterium]